MSHRWVTGQTRQNLLESIVNESPEKTCHTFVHGYEGKTANSRSHQYETLRTQRKSGPSRGVVEDDLDCACPVLGIRPLRQPRARQHGQSHRQV